MQLSMRDGLGLQQLPPRFTGFADHGANSRPGVNARPIACVAVKRVSTWHAAKSTSGRCRNKGSPTLLTVGGMGFFQRLLLFGRLRQHGDTRGRRLHLSDLKWGLPWHQPTYG